MHGSGKLSSPSWGNAQIVADEAGWEGSFTGIKRVDAGPIDLRAALTGVGLNDGLCTMLDILATGTDTGDTWIFDGVVYPCAE